MVASLSEDGQLGTERTGEVGTERMGQLGTTQTSIYYLDKKHLSKLEKLIAGLGSQEKCGTCAICNQLCRVVDLHFLPRNSMATNSLA
jgi:hypothetical protein